MRNCQFENVKNARVVTPKAIVQKTEIVPQIIQGNESIRTVNCITNRRISYFLIKMKKLIKNLEKRKVNIHFPSITVQIQ